MENRLVYISFDDEGSKGMAWLRTHPQPGALRKQLHHPMQQP